MTENFEGEKGHFLKIVEDMHLHSLESDFNHQMTKRNIIQKQEIKALEANQRELVELNELNLPELYSVMDFEYHRLKMNLHVLRTRLDTLNPSRSFFISVYFLMSVGAMVLITINYQAMLVQPFGQIAVSVLVSVFFFYLFDLIKKINKSKVDKLERQFLKEKAVEAEEFVVYMEKEISEALIEEFKITTE